MQSPWLKGFVKYLVKLTAAAAFLSASSIVLAVGQGLGDDELAVPERRLDVECRPVLRPPVYDRVDSLPTAVIENCVSIPIVDLLPNNAEIVSITFHNFSQVEMVLLVDQQSSFHWLRVHPDGPFHHQDVYRPPVRAFGEHSCLDPNLLCALSSVVPTAEGYFTVDRHRVQRFDYVWLPEEGVPMADIQEELVVGFGQMNGESEITDRSGLLFPTTLAEYRPFNSTFISPTIPVTPIIPHATDTLTFVSDTGSNRIVVLNTTAHGQLEFLDHFGDSGIPRSDDRGFDFPWGIAIYAPAWEVRNEAIYVNVFVADRRNNRLVKLDLGYHEEIDRYNRTFRRYDKPRLKYSGEYGQHPSISRGPEGLHEPMSISIYRHYLFVGEAGGNMISVLQVDHTDTSRMFYVTRLTPALGVQLLGSIAVSPYGFIWYTYWQHDSGYHLGNMYVPEPLRYSDVPDLFEDLLGNCVNHTWYNEILRFNISAYNRHMSHIINTSGMTDLFPNLLPYVDPLSFNNSEAFDFDRFNQTFFHGRGEMVYCVPPPAPTPFPMLRGDGAGWILGDQAMGDIARAGAPRVASLQAGVILGVAVFGAVLYRTS